MINALNRFGAWRTRRREAWEAVCNRCGLCCYQKRYRRGRLCIDLSAPCPHLDEPTRSCRVYENRFRVCMDCKKVTRYHALFSGLMPAECAYVKKYRRFQRFIPAPIMYHSREVRSASAKR